MEDNLFAEDGFLFTNESLSFVWKSIFNPYAGYIHLYPRLISILAVQFDLYYLPIIFFIAWICAVLYCSYIVFEFIYKQTNSILVSINVPVLILLQPHSAEVFFNITCAQWFLALPLIIILIDKGYKINYKNFFILILLGLTGPFSALLLPVLFLNILFKKDLKENYLKYIVIILTASIQVYFMVKSNRIAGDIDKEIINWLKSFYTFLTFGTKRYFAILSLLLWIFIFVYFIKSLYYICKQKFTKNTINIFLIVICIFIYYFAGLWTAKQSPTILNPLGPGARYFFVPYALFVIVIALITKNSRLLYFIFFIILIIDIEHFNKIYRQSLNFDSFVWFSKYVENINIPIHPQWPTFPGWHIEYKNKDIKKIIPIRIENKNLKLVNATLLSDSSIKTINKDAQLLFDMPCQCSKSKHIGLEISISRENEGWSQIFYTSGIESFSEEKSLRRYYPSGKIKMQFAFKNDNIKRVRIDPTEKDERIYIDYIKIYCEHK